MATINRARSLGETGNRLLDKAQNLLTAHWGSADWASRAGILKTVDWLLQVALHHPQPTRAGGRGLSASSGAAGESYIAK
jgi:hypothetical protein